jgi:glutaredoxin-related protein
MNLKIFISDHCLSCQEAVAYFREKGLDFEQINVTHDQHLFNEMLKLGGIATPFIVMGEQKFHAFDRQKIEKVLEDEDE